MENRILRDGREYRAARDDIRELTPVGTTWAIAVKILRLWSESIQNDETCIRMVLCDKEGYRIGATILPENVPRFRDSLVEGEWRFFMSFHVERVDTTPKLSTHKFEIVLKRTTSIRFIEPIKDCYFLNYPRFENILNGRAQYSVLTDIMGFVSAVGILRTERPALHNEEPYTLSFLLTDEKDEVIECTAYGSIARRFHDEWKAEPLRTMVCVLRFWTLEKEIGTDFTKTVCLSAPRCSQFMINPWIREAIEFRNRFVTITDRGSVIDP